MSIWRKNFGSIAILAALAMAAAQSPAALARDDGPKGFVYVESNDPNGNAIFAFKRADDGSLTPLPGSPFSAGGAGVTPTFALGPFDSDQELITNPDHTLLFAVNGGSDTIAVFKINGDGTLTAVPGSPFPSGGSNPVSVGLADDVLCVVNQDDDPGHPGQYLPSYTSFKVSPKGKLTPISHSTLYVDAGSTPSQALISPSEKLLFGADFLGGILRSIAINDKGQFRFRDAQPLPPAVFAGYRRTPVPPGTGRSPDAEPALCRLRHDQSNRGLPLQGFGRADLSADGRRHRPRRLLAHTEQERHTPLFERHRRPEHLGFRYQWRPDQPGAASEPEVHEHRAVDFSSTSIRQESSCTW